MSNDLDTTDTRSVSATYFRAWKERDFVTVFVDGPDVDPRALTGGGS